MFLQLLEHVRVVLAEDFQLVHAGVAEAIVPKFTVSEKLENVQIRADFGKISDYILADWYFVEVSSNFEGKVDFVLRFDQ